MSRSVIVTVLGAIVLIGAIVFLVFSYHTGDVEKVSGYNISASFSGIGGLKIGDDVQISGVKIGQISKIDLDFQHYLAIVTLEIDDHVKLPDDTTAAISSQSLLGGRFLSLEPGGSETFLPTDGTGKIVYTQAPQSLEDLLGKFIFSMTGAKDKSKSGSEESSGDHSDNTPVSGESVSAPTTPSTTPIPPASHP